MKEKQEDEAASSIAGLTLGRIASPARICRCALVFAALGRAPSYTSCSSQNPGKWSYVGRETAYVRVCLSVSAPDGAGGAAQGGKGSGEAFQNELPFGPAARNFVIAFCRLVFVGRLPIELDQSVTRRFCFCWSSTALVSSLVFGGAGFIVRVLCSGAGSGLIVFLTASGEAENIRRPVAIFSMLASKD